MFLNCWGEQDVKSSDKVLDIFTSMGLRELAYVGPRLQRTSSHIKTWVKMYQHVE